MNTAALNEATALIQGHSAEALHIICTIVFVYCGVRALFHRELKKVLIYSLVGLVVDIRSLLTLDSSLALASFFFHVFNFVIIVGMMLITAKLLREKAGSDKLDDMRGLGRAIPRTAIPLAAGLFAMMGLPPFSAFFSKYLMIAAFIDSGNVISSVLLAGGEVLYFLVFIRVIRIVFLDKYRGEALVDRKLKDLKPAYILLCFITIGGL